MTLFRRPSITTGEKRSVKEQKVYTLFRAAADGKWEQKSPIYKAQVKKCHISGITLYCPATP